jgi:hypothetical protein
MIFKVTHYLELRNIVSFIYYRCDFFYKATLLMFYKIYTTNLIVVGKMWNIKLIDMALRSSE